MKGQLILEDGSIYKGNLFGAVNPAGAITGEVVFNTSMTGYQEILTDPSYAGQIITLTFPLIGNYGTSPVFSESDKIWAKALIVRENYVSEDVGFQKLDVFLKEQNVTGISGIDTRSLTRHIRSHGTMRGLIKIESNNGDISCGCSDIKAEDDGNLVAQVTTRHVYRLPGKGPRVLVMDFGVKKDILRQLRLKGADVVVVPAFFDAKDIFSLKPDGILLSNGPGDPARVPGIVSTIKKLLGRVPIFGICLGHQLLALALGAETYKLKFGHRGANHPVVDLETGKTCMTSQNHGYAVREKDLKRLGLVITHKNLNDGTVEGLRHRYLPAFSVQFHPEAAPGPSDSNGIFDEFFDMMIKRRQREQAI
ncbi:MAG TPA: glutamine-hydrolyzing carbamoyl-phosphate synthase small subunit [Thermoanaerobacterales bacterium]|nr:glutamine-hydrolyzing carbamoyl-phosphate synthase small subunit [Thermoanaerobacterales bacterium]